MTHTTATAAELTEWVDHPLYWLLNNDKRYAVFKPELGSKKGYLLQYKNKTAYAPSEEVAKDYVEACVELGRWPG